MGSLHRNNIIRKIILVGAFLLCIGMAPISLGAGYDVIAIDPLPGYDRSRALGINNSGQVVGRFYNYDAQTDEAVDRQAFVWDSINGARDLPTLSGESSAWGINDNGMVSGYSYDGYGEQKAVLWDTSDGDNMIYIGTLDLLNQVSGDTSTAYDLNNLGQVVGNADIPNSALDFVPFHAFLFDETTGIQDLGTFTTAWPQWQNGYSIAYDINNIGEAVGLAHDSSWAFLPFVYDETNGMQELTRDPSYLNGEWYAAAINDSGLIGGHVIVTANQSLPFYWQDSSSSPIQITMPNGFSYGEIYGINDSGQMVGIMWDRDQEDATEHAFIFDIQNGVQDLNDLIDPASGWVLTFARDINDDGQIVGYGELNGEKRGFFLNFISSMKYDFDGDGKTDILWRHSDTGELIIWFMDGPVRSYYSTLGKVELKFKIEDVGDFDGDGKTDILWRHSDTGELIIWFMDGQVRLYYSTLGKVEFKFKIEDVGDFDGDGKTDILWRHSDTGELIIWFMDGPVRSYYSTFGKVELKWKIEDVGDFDGDGKTDILWRHSDTGELIIWFMDGPVRSYYSTLGKVELKFKIEDVGDFDGDGKTDILWRHSDTGELIIWFMDGPVRSYYSTFGKVELKWKIEDVGDFDGDGKTDILWRHSDTGALCIWFMVGSVRSYYSILEEVDLRWGIN